MSNPASPFNPKGNPITRNYREWKKCRGGKMPHIPYNRALTEKAKENRKNPTWAENRLWHELLNRGCFRGFKFTRQKPLDEYIVDFYCAELRLAIEVDGDSHAGQPRYDQRRTTNLKALGVEVVRYTNDEVMLGLDRVRDDVVRAVVERKRVIEVGRRGVEVRRF